MTNVLLEELVLAVKANDAYGEKTFAWICSNYKK